jgi:hypothetical protein
VSFRDYGKIVKRAAKVTDVEFIPDPQSSQRLCLSLAA